MIPGYKLFGVFSLYYSFHVLAFICLFAFLLWVCKKYDIPRGKTALAAVMIYVSAYIWMLLLYWVSTGFKSFGGQNIVRIFIWLPLFVWLYSKPLKIKWLDMCDMVAPCLVMNRGIAHIACIFEGCCYGYHTDSWIGIYNGVFHQRLFPVQLFEAATALAITAYLIWRMKKQDYKTKGQLYPIMLILFGGTRFFWEFFRNNDKLILGVSTLAAHALLACVVGVAWLGTAREYERRDISKSRRPNPAGKGRK